MMRLMFVEIAKDLVTNEEYWEFCDATGRDKGKTLGGRPKQPVTNVSWYDAVRFCNALSVRVGLRPAYDIAGGDSMDDVGWHDGNSQRTSHPVGRKRSNRWGLHDMSGNVWEWVSDWYGSYQSAGSSNPTGPTSGWYKVVRGGNWDMPASACRSSARSYLVAPIHTGNGIGFRAVRVP